MTLVDAKIIDDEGKVLVEMTGPGFFKGTYKLHATLIGFKREEILSGTYHQVFKAFHSYNEVDANNYRRQTLRARYWNG